MSLVGNKEPEVAVEDEDFARAIELVYEEALMRAAEIVRPSHQCAAVLRLETPYLFAAEPSETTAAELEHTE